MANVWEILTAPLDPASIKHRDGPGGKQLSYIDRGVVYERLDRAAPGDWHLTLSDLPINAALPESDRIAVKATLTVGPVVREDVGTGKDWKEAATDAFKRAAVHFGIGRELYEKSSGASGGGAVAKGGASSQAARPASSTSSGERMPFGKTKGQLLSDLPVEELTKTLDWCRKTDAEKFKDIIAKLEKEIAIREWDLVEQGA